MATDSPTGQAALVAPALLEFVPAERLNMLVDGVYAIVMTLLVLDLRLPEGMAPREALLHLETLGPKALAFVIGFVVAASAWAFVHHMNSLFARSNLLHVGLNLLALLVASLIPFAASVMGAFPHTFQGPAVYSVIVSVLTLIYCADLGLCQKALIPPVVDRKLVWTIFGLATAAGVWCLFVGLVIAPWNPTVALWALGVHFLGHWICLFATERPVRLAAAAIERWRGAHASPRAPGRRATPQAA